MLLPMRVNSQIVTGAEQMDQYLPLLKGKRIGMVVNHTSVVGRKQVHLLDTLLKREVRVVKVFAPEHGFRGNADAGETVKDGKDSRTGILIVSLYGDNKKPSAAQLKDVDVIVFDIQDVGARFYTYISTLAVVFMIAILLIAILCNNSKTKEETIVNQYDYTIKDTVEVIRIAPFLKNTTYIWNNLQEYGNKATITDSNYTPPQKYELKRVTVELKGNIAIVGTDCYITHKILSAEYYKFSYFGDKELAILHTSKGEIRIAKVNDGLSEQYPISIKYGNFLVKTPSAFIHTKLPEVYKIMN